MVKIYFIQAMGEDKSSKKEQEGELPENDELTSAKVILSFFVTLDAFLSTALGIYLVAHV